MCISSAVGDKVHGALALWVPFRRRLAWRSVAFDKEEKADGGLFLLTPSICLCRAWTVHFFLLQVWWAQPFIK